MSIRTYLRSWKGKKIFAALSWRDPLPFLAEMLMLPYIVRIRGF
jgi:hypothetical protein